MGITISEATANGLIMLLEDIMEIDSRANCSDKYFRTHFMAVAKANIVTGGYKELKDAIEAASAKTVEKKSAK